MLKLQFKKERIIRRSAGACMLACAVAMSGTAPVTMLSNVQAEEIVGSWVYESEYANYYYTDANGLVYRAEDLDMDYCELMSVPEDTTGEVSIPKSITVDGKLWEVRLSDGFKLPEGVTEKVVWVYDEQQEVYVYTDANGWKYSVKSPEDRVCYLESIPDTAEGEFQITLSAKIDDAEWPMKLSEDFVLPTGITKVIAPYGTEVNDAFFSKASPNLVVHGYTGDGIVTMAKNKKLKVTYVNVITDKQGVGYCILENIDPYAPKQVEVYDYTDKVKKVTIPKTIQIDGVDYTVISVRDKAFKNAKKLSQITLSDTVFMLGDSVFEGCKALTSVKMKNSVVYMGEKVFSGCGKLKSVTLSKKIVNIPKKTFYKCSSLTSITIPDAVNKVEQEAFYGCSKLGKITLGTKVTDIGTSAFAKCTKLKSVTVKSKVLSQIGKQAFDGEKNLKSITLKTTKLNKTSIGKNALKGTNKKLVIKVPGKQVKAYKKFMKKFGNKSVVVKKG